MKIRVIRSQRRRTIALQVTAAGEVVVRCPQRTAQADIDRLLRDKRDWLARSLAKMRARRSAFLVAGEGEEVLLGAIRKVETADIVEPEVSAEVLKYPVVWTEARRLRYKRDLLTRFCEREIPQARADLQRIIQDRVEWPSGAFKLRMMKRRWGSCARNGDLLFNSRLIEATPEAIRYVIRHELAHWVHFDHSKAFRALELRLVGGAERLGEAKAGLACISLDGSPTGEADDLL